MWRFSFVPSFALIFTSKVCLPNLYGNNDEANHELLTLGHGWVSWGGCWLLPLVFSFMPGNSFHEDPFHNFSRVSSGADSSVIPQILFFALSMDWCNICPFPVSWDFPWTPWPAKDVEAWLCSDVGQPSRQPQIHSAKSHWLVRVQLVQVVPNTPELLCPPVEPL